MYIFVNTARVIVILIIIIIIIKGQKCACIIFTPASIKLPLFLTEHLRISRQGQSEHPKDCITWPVLIRWSWQQYNVKDITALWEKHTPFIPPWRWGQLVPPRRYHIPSRLHGISFRKTLDFVVNAVEANVL